ncbi:hypothetical protein G9A89_023322 [Geosiphon pyriformis]|nr:hypothetical protein G9A89_023322 [Geosiphon pyriformis]
MNVKSEDHNSMDVVMRDNENRRTTGPNFGMNPASIILLKFLIQVPVNECTYETTFWPQVSGFVRLALKAELQNERPLHTYSHEELYRSIYWMCWQGFQKRLHADLMREIEETLIDLANQLEIIPQPEEWVVKFAEIGKNHAKAADILSSIFAYLDKTYIQYFLHENLKKILFDQFRKQIVEKFEKRVVYVFGVVLDNPEKFGVNIVADIVISLYKMNPDYIYLNPTVFQNSIPDMQMPLDFEDIRLRHQRLETQYQIENLKREGWEPGISQLKRTSSSMDTEENEEDEEHNSVKRVR